MQRALALGAADDDRARLVCDTRGGYLQGIVGALSVADLTTVINRDEVR